MSEKLPKPSRTFEDYEAEVLRLLVERGLEQTLAKELAEADKPYITEMHQENAPAKEAVDELMPHVSKERPSDVTTIPVAVNGQACAYMQQLIQTGLWGTSLQEVAQALIHGQLIALMAQGHIAKTEVAP